jgi:hypothetical protein
MRPAEERQLLISAEFLVKARRRHIFRSALHRHTRALHRSKMPLDHFPLSVRISGRVFTVFALAEAV